MGLVVSILTSQNMPLTCENTATAEEQWLLTKDFPKVRQLEEKKYSGSKREYGCVCECVTN